ncbi:MAG: hypothetical protein ACQKHC_02005 [Candidatus Phytoplasma pruni]|uniref:hypothetical protein n=1 Tax=16SrIII (X-disease group) TaxID=85623 RepID=UPI000374FB7D|nr:MULTISPECIES: hypothetical protein [16SrIII (X-disease group)]
MQKIKINNIDATLGQKMKKAAADNDTIIGVKQNNYLLGQKNEVLKKIAPITRKEYMEIAGKNYATKK